MGLKIILKRLAELGLFMQWQMIQILKEAYKY